VSEDRLGEMVRVMRGEIFADTVGFTARAVSEAALTCPGCHVELTPETFADQPIDRCPAGHGVWLDDGELASALRTVGEA